MADPLAPLLSAAEQAAIPTAIACLEAFQQFEADMGPDPAQWALNYPGAKLKFLGTLGLQVPILAKAEGGALMSSTNIVSGFITTLKAAQTTTGSSSTAAPLSGIAALAPGSSG